MKNIDELREVRSHRELVRTYSVNEDYFKMWSNEMAYWLGFIYADGYISKDGMLRVALQYRDKDHLEKLKKEMESEHLIRTEYVELGDKVHKSASFAVYSKEVCRDLEALNCGNLKRTDFDISIVPLEYRDDFIRGLFDGDGSVGKSYPTNKFGIRTTKTQIKTRFIANSEDVISEVLERLTDFGVKPVNIYYRSKLYQLEYSTMSSKIIYKYLYDNDGFYLKRKKDRFEEVMQERRESFAE